MAKVKTTTQKGENQKAKQSSKSGNNNQLTAPIYSLTGEKVGEMTLPKELFGQEVNKQLLAQAVHVYLSNLKGHFASTKTRGEVEGSTRKIYRQKGTGRARHGGIRAPIFVGGGIALGPKPRKVILDLPKKMKKAALISALSYKQHEKQAVVVRGLPEVKGKTKEVAKLFEKLGRGSTLVVTEAKLDLAKRAVKNLPDVEILPYNQLNAYNILTHKHLLLSEGAIEKLKEGFANA